MLKNLLFISILLPGVTLTAQIPAVEWIYTFGSRADEAIVASDIAIEGKIIKVDVLRNITDFDQG